MARLKLPLDLRGFQRLFLLLALAVSPYSYSHPHAWLEMETAPQFDDEGWVTGIRVGWVFDELYSVYTLDGQAPTPEVLAALAEVTLSNLTEYSYFTQVLRDDVPVKIKQARYEKSDFIDGRWRLEFVTTLSEKIDPAQHKLSYQVFDPTYYVSILHRAEGQSVHLNHRDDCSYTLIPSNPPKNMTLIAAAIDYGQPTPKGLGEHFAEKVVLSCP